MNQVCPDCGAVLTNGQPCETHFHQMLFWENEDPANWRVHHLTVLCYYLQHPALYSPEGLEHGRHLLKRFIEDGESPEQMRQETKGSAASNNRNWKIKGTADSHGAYNTPIMWQMNAADIVAGGIANYYQNVKRWAATVHKQLNDMKGE
jgi:hypothetical protein